MWLRPRRPELATHAGLRPARHHAPPNLHTSYLDVYAFPMLQHYGQRCQCWCLLMPMMPLPRTQCAPGRSRSLLRRRRSQERRCPLHRPRASESSDARLQLDRLGQRGAALKLRSGHAAAEEGAGRRPHAREPLERRDECRHGVRHRRQGHLQRRLLGLARAIRRSIDEQGEDNGHQKPAESPHQSSAEAVSPHLQQLILELLDGAPASGGLQGDGHQALAHGEVPLKAGGVLVGVEDEAPGAAARHKQVEGRRGRPPAQAHAAAAGRQRGAAAEGGARVEVLALPVQAHAGADGQAQKRRGKALVVEHQLIGANSAGVLRVQHGDGSSAQQHLAALISVRVRAIELHAPVDQRHLPRVPLADLRPEGLAEGAVAGAARAAHARASGHAHARPPAVGRAGVATATGGLGALGQGHEGLLVDQRLEVQADEPVHGVVGRRHECAEGPRLGCGHDGRTRQAAERFRRKVAVAFRRRKDHREAGAVNSQIAFAQEHPIQVLPIVHVVCSACRKAYRDALEALHCHGCWTIKARGTY
mmetsp:Transcript_177791/g.570123  ORF Transcript_177791/g.570123 Transcript_177791/m.570123 type:complete len:533 (-) Transcript_177791:216-1814(-)